MSYTLVLEWMPGDLYMSAVTARCAAPTSSYSVVWLPPNKVYQITLYCGSTSLVSFLVGAFRGKAWSYMSKTNTEKMAPETQTPEMANGMKLDVRVRPIAPMGNLLAFANVTIGGCFKIDGFRICSSEKGLYVNMPATQDKGGNWKDVCWPVTAEFRKQLNDALIDGYGQAIENLQATLEATKGAAEKPSLTGTLKENAGKVKEQPTKPAPSKNEQAR